MKTIELILNQPVVNLLGYCVVGGFLLRAIWNHIQIRWLANLLPSESQHIAEQVQTLSENKWSLINVRWHTYSHPFSRLIQKFQAQTYVDRRKLHAWLNQELQRFFENLELASTGNRGMAIFAGFCGTLMGIFAGAKSYAITQDQALMLNSIALSLMTTLVGGLAGEIESANTRRLAIIRREQSWESHALIQHLISKFGTYRSTGHSPKREVSRTIKDHSPSNDVNGEVNETVDQRHLSPPHPTDNLEAI